MSEMLFARLVPILLLIGSNVFMTIAWYGHLKFKSAPLLLVILASWSIALVEYCLAVPANRWGSAVYSAAQLKAMQEVITLTVFVGFSILYLGQKITINHLIGFGLIAAGAWLSSRHPPDDQTSSPKIAPITRYITIQYPASIRNSARGRRENR